MERINQELEQFLRLLINQRQDNWDNFEPDQHQSKVESVNKFKKRTEVALEEAKAALVKSKDNMAKYYD